MKSPPHIFLPNFLSLVRILIGILIPLLLLSQREEVLAGRGVLVILAVGLFIGGALTDFWDGWLARKHRLETSFGRILDPTADKVLILGTMASFAALGVYSYWYLVPLFIREIGVTFCRLVWLSEGKAVGAERAGKVKMVTQVFSVLCSFVYLAFPQPILFYLNYGFLFLALFATLYSGLFFFLRHRKLLTERNLLRTVAALGVGYLRPFPGTYGSLLGLLGVLLVGHDLLLHFLVFLGFLGLAYAVIPRLKLTPEEDPSEIVIDEACGILIAFLGLPLNVNTICGGFLLFRFFDVIKVFPICWLERRKGTHGILLDDIGAGLYTWLVLRILTR